MRYWLGPWVWTAREGRSSCWQAPSGLTPVVDLRSNIQSGLVGGASGGAGVFIGLSNPGSDYVDLGDDEEAPQPLRVRSAFETLASVPTLQSDRLPDIVWELLTLHADPVGETAPCPLGADRTGLRVLHLGGRLVRSARVMGHGDYEASLLDLLRRQYRAVRDEAMSGRSQADHHLKVLGGWAQKYRLPAGLFRPVDLPDEGIRRPTTTITESFNKADGPIGPDLTWTMFSGTGGTEASVVSNQLKVNDATQEHNFRAETDLSSDDVYCQMVTGASFTSSNRFASLMRKDSSATLTYYRWGYFGGVWEIAKFVSGTETVLANAYTAVPDPNNSFRGQCDGSTITGWHLGVQRDSVVDTSISGNVRCGVMVGNQTTVYVDNFEAADLLNLKKFILNRP